jgi:hypothetical protein
MRSRPFGFFVVLAITSLVFVSCGGEGGKCPEEITREFTVPAPYKYMTVGGNFIIEILPGKEYTMKATGCANDLADMTLNVSDNVLDIRFSRHRSKRYGVYVTVTAPGGAQVQFFKTPRIVTKERKDEVCSPERGPVAP